MRKGGLEPRFYPPDPSLCAIWDASIYAVVIDITDRVHTKLYTVLHDPHQTR